MAEAQGAPVVDECKQNKCCLQEGCCFLCIWSLVFVVQEHVMRSKALEQGLSEAATAWYNSRVHSLANTHSRIVQR